MLTKIKSMLHTLAATNPTTKVEVVYPVYTEELGFGVSNNYNTPAILLANLPKEIKDADIISISVQECVKKAVVAECHKNRRRIPKDAPKEHILVIDTDMVVEV